jgi:hypothetical protein
MWVARTNSLNYASDAGIWWRTDLLRRELMPQVLVTLLQYGK